MNESPIHIDRSCIFRETFESAQGVANNRYAKGIISGGVQIKDGEGKFDGKSGSINYKLYKKDRLSIRIIFKIKSLPSINSYFYIEYSRDGVSAIESIRLNSNGTITASGVSIYLNNKIVNSPFPIELNKKYELIVTYSTNILINNFWIGANKTATFCNIIVELFEMYSRSLSASEVKSLYQEQLYTFKPSLSLLLDFDSINGIVPVDRNLSYVGTPKIIKVGKTYNYLFDQYNAVYRILANIKDFELKDTIISLWFNPYAGYQNGYQTTIISQGTIAFGPTYVSNFGIIMSNIGRIQFQCSGSPGVNSPSVPILNKKFNHYLVYFKKLPYISASYFFNGSKVGSISTNLEYKGTGNLQIGGETWSTNSSKIRFQLPKLQIFDASNLNSLQIDQFAAQLYNSQKWMFV